MELNVNYTEIDSKRFEITLGAVAIESGCVYQTGAWWYAETANGKYIGKYKTRQRAIDKVVERMVLPFKGKV